MERTADRLAYPTSSTDFEKFRNRVRQAAPQGVIDGRWISNNLDIPSLSNANATLRALKAAGFVDEAGLTGRGRLLRGDPGSDEYRAALVEAIKGWIGEDRVNSIRAGTLNRENLPGRLRQAYNVGDSAVAKALSGLRWLASEAQEAQLFDAFGGNTRTAPRAQDAARHSNERRTTRSSQSPSPGGVATVVANSFETRKPNQPEIHLDINVHIDASASPEVIEQVFASMARHLYRD